MVLEDLAKTVGKALTNRGFMLATAESCTGGWVAQTVTMIPGSSGWFERGYVTYSNAAKRELLEVSEETLQSAGAVSEATAREMAQGALAHSRAQVSLAITGVAGPDGGTPDKPVGTVCFAWAGPQGITSDTRQLYGDRHAVRRQSVIIALDGVLNLLHARA